MERAYTAIGRAVVAAQRFETVLVPVFEFFKMKSDPRYLDETQGYVRAGAFKIPVASIVKTLSAKGSIASDLETRLKQYVDDRHMLIHRWMQNHGWPDEGDAAGFTDIMELATRVEREANSLTRALAGYMVKYSDPEWAAANHDEYERRVAQLFHLVHREEPDGT